MEQAVWVFVAGASGALGVPLVRQLVAESMVLVYGFGDHGAEFLTEQHPAAERSSARWLQQSVDALRGLERQVLQAASRGEIEGIVLRFGFSTGPCLAWGRWFGCCDDGLSVCRTACLGSGPVASG
jgi:hypothetical protein